jgi:hypothetical protein
MRNSRPSDPAERSPLMRLFYRDWRPTRLGRLVNRFACWWPGLGLPPSYQAVLEVRGRASGRRRSSRRSQIVIPCIGSIPHETVIVPKRSGTLKLGPL